MFFFSFHPNDRDLGNHALYARGFVTSSCKTMADLGNRVMRQLNSPVVWKCGIRKAPNFAFAECAVLDVDEGLSLRDAMEGFASYRHVIGTTKSHQKLKGNKVADRFRVFIALEKRVKSADIYQAVNVSLAEKFGGDLQACGGHMAFMPLKEIVQVSNGGKRILVPDWVPPQSRRSVPVIPPMGVKGDVPPYIQRWLTFGCEEGQRNLTCFKAACGLFKRGFKEDEIVNLLLSSALPINASEEVASQVRSAVKSAARRAR